MMKSTFLGCRSNCGRRAWPRPSHRSSAAMRLIANILQGTDPVRRRHERPTELPPISRSDRFRFLQILARDPGHSRHAFGGIGWPAEAEELSAPIHDGGDGVPRHDIRIGGLVEREEE